MFENAEYDTPGVYSTVGWMTDCWAEKMAATSVGSRSGRTAAKTVAKTASYIAVSGADSIVGGMTHCYPERITATRVIARTGQMTAKTTAMLWVGGL